MGRGAGRGFERTHWTPSRPATEFWAKSDENIVQKIIESTTNFRTYHKLYILGCLEVKKSVLHAKYSETSLLKIVQLAQYFFFDQIKRYCSLFE